ncbi:MAG: ABC-F family ATP-binding cassette domain-containing protein, partial [bacterium]
MAVLQADKIGIAFGDKQILTEASLVVGDKERIGMVGRNGSGKSTFLNCLTGELVPDRGTVSIPSGVYLGYLEQLPEHSPDATAWDVVMASFGQILEQRRQLRELEQQLAAGGPDLDRVLEQYAKVSHAYEMADGYACEATARRILLGLGFSENQFKQPWTVFSGGERTRLNLGCLLAKEPRLLLLDEPTNNLDVDAVEWLEDYLITYSGAMLVVSHDRMFLDRVCTRIVELRDGCLKSYPGNYSDYVKLKKEEGIANQRAYEKQQAYIKKTEDYILRFKAGIKAKQARGRQSQLNRLKRIERVAPQKAISPGHIKMDQESAGEVVVLKNISKSFAGRQLFDRVNLTIYKGT